jgi:adenosylcobinamide-GDP ribazoletransferase
MKNFISAIQFLTIFPVGKAGAFDPEGMLPFFPMTGMMLGLMLSGADMIFSQLWHESAAAVLDVVLLAVLTGALHIDGLGDTADGLYGNRPRERRLAIMKDSRIGAMGLVAVVCGLAVKWGGILSLNEHRQLLLLIIPAYSRAGMLFGFRFLEYGRPEGGTAHAFFGNRLRWSAFAGLLIPVAISFFAGWRGLWLNLVFAGTVAVILLFYKKRMGCITGDMLGAMCEITESVLFLMAGM